MRDGDHLAANVVRPVEPGKYPVVINYLPYGKQPDPYFAARGYVAIFAEKRGTAPCARPSSRRSPSTVPTPTSTGTTGILGGVRSNHPYVWHGAPNVLYTMLRGPLYDDGKGGQVVDVETWKRHIAENGWEGFFRRQWDHDTYDGYWVPQKLIADPWTHGALGPTQVRASVRACDDHQGRARGP